MSEILAIFVLILFSAFLIYALIYDIVKKIKQKRQEKALKATGALVSSETVVLKFLADNSCVIISQKNSSEGEQTIIYFIYCGGLFNVVCSKVSQDAIIYLPIVYSLEPKEEYINLLTTVTAKFSATRKYIKAYPVFRENTNTYDVEFSYETIDLSFPTLGKILNLMMRFEFDFKDMIKKEIDNQEDPQERFKREREFYLLMEAECQESEEPNIWKFSPEKRFTVGRIICNLFGAENLVQLMSLTIYGMHSSAQDDSTPSNDTHGITIIDKPSDVYDFDLVNALYANKSADGSLQPLTVKIRSDRNYYILDLEPISDTQFALYLRLTLLCVHDEGSEEQDIALPFGTSAGTSYITVFDKTSENNRQSEFHYMLIDAQDKINDGREDELSEEQKFIVKIHDPSYHLYFGVKLFYNARYADAIWYLEPIFCMVKMSLPEWNEDEQAQFLEIAYFLGFSYYQIKNYEMAIYYLYFTQIATSIRYSTMFVNALTEGRDVRVFREIDSLLDTYNNNKQISNDNIMFCEFLLRRRARACVYFNDLDTAESLCNQLLDSQNSQQFAQDELEHIKKLREAQPKNKE